MSSSNQPDVRHTEEDDNENLPEYNAREGKISFLESYRRNTSVRPKKAVNFNDRDDFEDHEDVYRVYNK